MKRCYKCAEEKPFEDFFRDSTRKDGRDTKCKKCQKDYFNEYRLKNKEKIRELQAKWYKRKHETS
jgi:NAD-dependent SIR2 family protein deacetylase